MRFPLFLEALRKGSKLTDSGLWKQRAGATVALTAFLSVCAKIARSYGYDVPFTDEDIAYIAGGIVVLVSLYFNYATSDSVGVLPDKPRDNVDVQREDPGNPTAP